MWNITHVYVAHDLFICETWLLYMSAWLIHTWDMTHLYVKHNSCLCGTWLIHKWDMTYSYVRHDSFICVTCETPRGCSRWVHVLQCLHCVTVCCSVLQCVAGSHVTWLTLNECSAFVAVCCSALQCLAVCCSVLQCVAVCCTITCDMTHLEWVQCGCSLRAFKPLQPHLDFRRKARQKRCWCLPWVYQHLWMWATWPIHVCSITHSDTYTRTLTFCPESISICVCMWHDLFTWVAWRIHMWDMTHLWHATRSHERHDFFLPPTLLKNAEQRRRIGVRWIHVCNMTHT